MALKFKVNILLICLYLGTMGNYVLEDIIKFENADTVVTLIIDFFIIVLTLSFLKLNLRTPKFLYIFILLSTISYFLSDNNSLYAHFNGLRETLVFLCYFIIFEVLFEKKLILSFIQKFKVFAYLFLSVQIPVCIIQFINHGAGDAVGGTFGPGGSGVLSFSIFILIYFLLENSPNSTTKRLKKGMPYLIFLIPIALNETKISFVLLLLFFFSQITLKNFRTTIFSLIIGIGFVFSFSFFYSSQEGFSYKNPLEGIYNQAFLEEYLMGDVNEYYSDVPRFTKIAIGTQKLSSNGNLILGEDYGAFMRSNLKENTGFAKKNQWLISGSIVYIFYLLITGGLLLIVFINWLVLSEAVRMKGKNYSPQLLFFVTSIFVIILFYNDGLRSPVFSFLFVFILFFSKYYKVKSQHILQ